LKVLVIFTHPDEGEIYAGGTSAIYAAMGHKVKFLSITNGAAGHYSMQPEDLARCRYKEAMQARQVLGLAEYEVLSYRDGRLKDVELIHVRERRLSACHRENAQGGAPD
jgi:LmbE family N-acetylglucosaminyl deacetylase